MSREINHHKLNDCNNGLDVLATDEPGAGGANHEYRIQGPSNGFIEGTGMVQPPEVDVRINFQNGPIKENGINGVTQEALLAIVLDRLESFQNGPYHTEENAQAIYHTQEALNFLHKRTKDRIERGVEGTNQQ